MFPNITYNICKLQTVFCIKRSLFAVELGNELAGDHGHEAHLNAYGYAQDFAELMGVIQGIYKNDPMYAPKIFGCDSSLNTGIFFYYKIK